MIVISANGLGARTLPRMTCPPKMLTHHLLHLLKFIGVLLYGGGLVAAFVAETRKERQRAVHGVASPGLLVTWVAGYLLTLELGISLGELWVVVGLALSLASQLALVASLRHARATRADVLSAALPLLLVLVAMVFRPTWGSFRP